MAVALHESMVATFLAAIAGLLLLTVNLLSRTAGWESAGFELTRRIKDPAYIATLAS
jgi:hypothetical protein